MGPRGGDELNLVVRGANYGYPVVSNGDHYSGADIPDHDTRPEFAAPAVWWNPVISPSSLLFYSGSEFPDWRGDLFVGSLKFGYLARLDVEDGKIVGEERLIEDLDQRVRDVRQGPDGNLYLLTDEADAVMLRIEPAE